MISQEVQADGLELDQCSHVLVPQPISCTYIRPGLTSRASKRSMSSHMQAPRMSIQKAVVNFSDSTEKAAVGLMRSYMFPVHRGNPPLQAGSAKRDQTISILRQRQLRATKRRPVSSTDMRKKILVNLYSKGDSS